MPLSAEAAIARAPTRAWIGPAFATTLFSSALLIFLVQPLMARLLTPLLGGAPGVWNTAMVFFQAALLVGYGYAFWLARLRSVRAQVAIHALVLAAACLALPLGVTDALGPPPSTQASLWLLCALALSAGAPFAALAATAPLLQAWYARTGEPDAADPYHLYAASNVGSMLALLGYPLLVEPTLTLGAQTASWSWGFAIVALAILACGAWSARRAGPAPIAPARVVIAWPRRLRWIGAAAAASALLLAASQHIATDVASAPMLWTLPLALYLLTFVIAFGKGGERWRGRAAAMLATATACVILTLLSPKLFLLGLIASLALVFAGSLVAHGALAADRPAAGGLTEFYFCLSLGGVIGGAGAALLAPVLFDSVLELPLAAAACLLLAAPKGGPLGRRRWWLVAALGAALIAVAVADSLGQSSPFVLSAALVAAVAAGVRAFAGAPRAAALLALVGLTATPLAQRVGVPVAQDRSFFGVLRVAQTNDVEGPVKLLMHGTTLHGAQRTDEARATMPLTYYADVTPLGDAMDRTLAAISGPADVGILGLGAGALLCQTRPGDRVRTYEIDPIVARWAMGEHFTYRARCAPNAPIVLGDGRLALMDESDVRFDLLVIDAFSSDAIPTHLMTREAIRLYASRLKPNGVLVLHVSNRHLALAPEAAAVARAEGLAALSRALLEGPKASYAYNPTVAVVMARDIATLEAKGFTQGWAPVAPAQGRPWSDDYVNLPRALIARLAQH